MTTKLFNMCQTALTLAALTLAAAPALAKPVSIDLPVSKFARSAQESVVVHCSRGEQMATEKATHDASLLPLATKVYVNKKLSSPEPVVLTVRAHTYTWSVGEAVARTKALVVLDASMLSRKAEAGETVEVPITDGGRQGGHTVTHRFALEGVQDVDEIAVASELMAAGLCYNDRAKDRAAAIVRVTVSLEMNE